jgi:transposase
MNRRTVRRLVQAPEPPRYRREATGSILDPFDQVLRELVREIEDIKAPRATELLRDDYGYQGSVDLVRRRLAELRPKEVRAAQ